MESVYTVTNAELEASTAAEQKTRVRVGPSLLLAGFTVLYFADICLRAKEKYFWFDELYQVYESRLSLAELWKAMFGGFDFNPPLLALLTRAANALLGEGLIVTRLPAIVGFWVFSLALYRVVSKRAGVAAGFAAMLVPFFTGANYYAYEARPGGLVLGCCGLALVAWQNSLDGRRRGLWLVLFAFFFYCGAMTHCYAILIAVPFGVAELYANARAGRIDVRRWAALIIPTLAAVAFYIPLSREYHRVLGRTIFLEYSPLRWTQIANFYNFLLGPCILIVLSVAVLFAFRAWSYRRVDAVSGRGSTPLEVPLALGFLLLPVMGLMLALVLHSPFYDRYFLATAAGYGLLVGLGIGLGERVRWTRVVLAVGLGLCLVNDFGSLVWHRMHGWPEQRAEPSSGFSNNQSLQGPLANYTMLGEAAKTGERIVIMWPIDFMYLVNYAPELRGQIYYVGWNQQDPLYHVLALVQPFVPFAYHTVTKSEFLRDRSDFLAYGVTCAVGKLPEMTGMKTPPKSYRFSNGHYLAEMSLGAGNGLLVGQ